MTVRKFIPMSDREIALHSQEQNAYFKKLKDQSKKSFSNQLDKFTQVIRHYDNSDNYLYEERIFTRDKHNKRTIYTFDALNGGYVMFIDRDTDGNIDEMQYIDRQNYPQYNAYDEDDNGTFDTAKRRIQGHDNKFDLYF